MRRINRLQLCLFTGEREHGARDFVLAAGWQPTHRFEGFFKELGHPRSCAVCGAECKGLRRSSEFGLLRVFAANPKRVLSRERLLELANARDAEAFDRAVDLRIMRIRRKIEIDPTKPAVIRTIRGGGYLFSPVGEKG
jgi:hypothetical protein